jgi:hypothetical protein
VVQPCASGQAWALTISTAPENSKMAATSSACLMVRALAPTEGLKVLATSWGSSGGGGEQGKEGGGSAELVNETQMPQVQGLTANCGVEGVGNILE